MGKRSKVVLNPDTEPETETGLSNISKNNLSKKRKKKRLQDDDNPENATSGEGNYKNVSLEDFSDTQGRHKKKNKNNLVDSTPADHEVYVKQKKQKNKSVIQEESKNNFENNDLLPDIAGENRKKKNKNKKLNPNYSESEHDTPSATKEAESSKKNKTKSLDYQKETSDNINSERQIKKNKKKKHADETVEETELNFKGLAGNIGNSKLKKKKNQLFENELEIQENGINNLNESIDSTNKDKKKKKKKDKLDLAEHNADCPPKKIKPAMAKFNAEEAAVTEEEINQFCDDIDEEDNKQYEDWVQLIESMLGPRKHDVNKT